MRSRAQAAGMPEELGTIETGGIADLLRLTRTRSPASLRSGSSMP
jgi:hypothetical protein